MSNKKNVPYIVVFAALFLTFAFFGCNEDGNVASVSSVENFSSPDFAILDFDDAMNSLAFATFDNDMSFGDFPPPGMGLGDSLHDGRGPKPPFGGGEGMPPGMGNRPPGGGMPGQGINGQNRPPEGGRHLFPILKDLNLAQDQIDLVKELMDEHRDCMNAAFEHFREANREIIESANEERRAIHQQVIDGTITREEAEELIQQLNERTHEAILNNPESGAAHEEMCSCKLSVLDSIREILTAEQQPIWDEWTAELEGPCFS